MSKFIIYESKDSGDKNWRWRLKDGNNEIIAQSTDAYLKAKIEPSILLLKEQVPNSSIVEEGSNEDQSNINRFQYYEGNDSEWRWRFRNFSEDIIAAGEGYTTKQGVKRGVENVKEEIPRAEIVWDDDERERELEHTLKPTNSKPKETPVHKPWLSDC